MKTIAICTILTCFLSITFAYDHGTYYGLCTREQLNDGYKQTWLGHGAPYCVFKLERNPTIRYGMCTTWEKDIKGCYDSFAIRGRGDQEAKVCICE
jgi:hypothetical protein